MPQALVRQRRGLVDLYRITSSQRAQHAAVFFLRRAHFTPFRDDVPGVARDGRARRLREGLSCCSREDGEHLCSVAATASALGCAESFFCGVAVLGCGAANGCSLVGAVDRRCKTANERRATEPCPCFTPQMRYAAALRQAWSTAASRCTRPSAGVSQSNRRRKAHARDGSVSRGLLAD